MQQLHHVLATSVDKWRTDGYPCSAFPAIAEILEYQTDPETNDLRFLRKPQMRALETYWYLRLVEQTPHIRELYLGLRNQKLFSRKLDLIKALDISRDAYDEVDNELDELWHVIETNDKFVKKHKLQAVRETFNLAYPSYILALAMGAGKTILIGAIIATEFAMALEYPHTNFVENALVFAPGTTILESLRELSSIRYDQLLPPRLYNQFAPNLKLTFTRDGEKDVPVVRGSSFNVVVTNTEKIRIQKQTRSQAKKGWTQLQLAEQERRDTEVANLRLQTIASLPHLAVFSDEAHHTYGQQLGENLKQVRKTVDYLHTQTNLIAVVNTTGTPYFEKQALKDVVIWYGLSEGIRDGILKEVNDGVKSYRFDESNITHFVNEIVRDFFKDYGGVRLPNGAPAKLAMYFPQTNDLEELRPVVEQTLIELGHDSSTVLRNTSVSTKDEIDAFNRLNDPVSPHRVILLVNKGTEGWNCPSLFACALVRNLGKSKNFVLQAATRCLRQVPGNNRDARIYLSSDNRKTLDDQLQATFGETMAKLDNTKRERKELMLKLLKPDVAPLYISVPITHITRKVGIQAAMLDGALKRPDGGQTAAIEVTSNTIQVEAANKTMLEPGSIQTVTVAPDSTDLYAAAVELASRYRLAPLALRKALAAIYPENEIPLMHLPLLAQQLEALFCDYEQTTEYVEVTLALVKKEGWEYVDGEYTATVTYSDKEINDDLILHLRGTEADPLRFGYHYAPYKFASKPERQFFEAVLRKLADDPDHVEDVYFTGGITDSKKTDFFVEWTDAEGKHHRYFPDFIIRKQPRPGDKPGSGPCLIVEIKSSQNKSAIKAELQSGSENTAMTKEARKSYATLRWVDLNEPGKGNQLAYEIIFDDEKLLSDNVLRFLEGEVL